VLKALFLDRDGIINIDHGYVYKEEDFDFSPAIFDLVRLFVKESYSIFVVTNQSGIGRGYYSQEAFDTLSQWMIAQFKAENINIEEVAYCPHLPTDSCNCRKPKTGMIESILTRYEIDLSKAYMIGDKQSDMDLAKNAGIKHAIAISDKKLQNATQTFETIQAYKEYLDKNQGKIL